MYFFFFHQIYFAFVRRLTNYEETDQTAKRGLYELKIDIHETVLGLREFFFKPYLEDATHDCLRNTNV